MTSLTSSVLIFTFGALTLFGGYIGALDSSEEMDFRADSAEELSSALSSCVILTAPRAFSTRCFSIL